MILSSLSNWCTSVIIASSVVLLTSSVLDLTLVYLRLSNVSIAFCYCTFHQTSSLNLQNHLYSKHTDIYNKLIVKKKWHLRLSTDEKGGGDTSIGALRRGRIPKFSLSSFCEYLVRFIVVDNQVMPYLYSKIVFSYLIDLGC